MNKKIVLALCMSFILFGHTLGQEVKSRKITIGMIGKIGTNPVFIAAHSGARVAAKELEQKYKAEIHIDWQTPDNEDVQKQEGAIIKFIQLGVQGIAISCSDANYLTPAINNAVEKGIPVMCFDSDAPESNRFAYYGADDIEFGRAIIEQLAKEINNRGTIAVLAGSKNALNQQLRLKGILEEIKNYPNISLPSRNIYNHIENPDSAAELVTKEQRKKPEIVGWAFQGSWPLLKKNAIKWQPGEVKIVAGNAVPAELEYVKSGHVQSLIGINCFEYGYRAVEILLDKISFNKNPEQSRMFIKLTIVNKENVEDWSLNWKKWLIKEAIYH